MVYLWASSFSLSRNKVKTYAWPTLYIPENGPISSAHELKLQTLNAEKMSRYGQIKVLCQSTILQSGIIVQSFYGVRCNIALSLWIRFLGQNQGFLKPLPYLANIYNNVAFRMYKARACGRFRLFLSMIILQVEKAYIYRIW